MQKIQKAPRVLILASEEFYPEYRTAFTKLDKVLHNIVEANKDVYIMVDLGLKATKLIEKYVESRNLKLYTYIPNRLRKEGIWQKSISTLIKGSVDYLVVFYHTDPSEFMYAITTCKKKFIPVRMIDLANYEE